MTQKKPSHTKTLTDHPVHCAECSNLCPVFLGMYDWRYFCNAKHAEIFNPIGSVYCDSFIDSHQTIS